MVVRPLVVLEPSVLEASLGHFCYSGGSCGMSSPTQASAHGPLNGALCSAQPSLTLTQEGHSDNKTSLQHSSFEYRWII
jgi:hypothetical protein